MNFGVIVFAFVMVAIVGGGLILIAANNSSTAVTDTYGSTYDAQANSTNTVIQNMTAAGTAASGGLVVVLAALGCIAAIGTLAAVAVMRR